MRLAGKVALITGAAQGMGAAEARLFAREGARVALADVLPEEGKKVEKEINSSGGEAIFVPLDVTREADWQRAVESTAARFGTLNVLVNNAGIFRRVPLEETSLELWNQVMDVNATGVFLGTRAVIPVMRECGGGSIVNISSVGGIIGLPNNCAYQASKGAVRIFTKATAIEHAREGIRANSIHPGVIDTPMISSLMEDLTYLESMLATTPLGRLGTAEDVAYGVLYLASDESSYVTGAELVIDGGVIAQ